MLYISIVQLDFYRPAGTVLEGVGTRVDVVHLESVSCRLQAVSHRQTCTRLLCLLCSPPSAQQLFNINIFNWQQTLQIEDKKSHTTRPAPRPLSALLVYSPPSAQQLFNINTFNWQQFTDRR